VSLSCVEPPGFLSDDAQKYVFLCPIAHLPATSRRKVSAPVWDDRRRLNPEINGTSL
jgi:hypothetical protein